MSTKYDGPVYSYIRFSTAKQAEGDTTRRQTAIADEWCKARGLVLDSTLSDRGVSAFAGKNVTHGALGRFREAIKLGLVKPGSTLLVENLDRLSREQIFAALGVFTEIITSGVRIYSLMDNQEYTLETIRTNPYQLMYTIGAFARGHEESQTKSRRLREVFGAKRKDLANKKWKNSCPPWLKFNADKTGFVVVESKADIVRRIYSEYISGVGVFTLARKLQSEGVGRLSDGKVLWNTSTIQHYLTTRTVVGEFQPYQRKAGGRVAVGEPIKDYYPSIVSGDTFATVQRMISKKKKVRGRVSENVVNIFRGVLRCPYCGSSILLKRNATTGGNRSEMYVCDRAQRQQECVAYGWDRGDFEVTFLEYAEQVHAEYQHISTAKVDNTTEASRVQNRLYEIEDEETRMLELYQKGRVAGLDKIQAMLDKLQNEKEALTKKKNEIENAASGRSQKMFRFDIKQFLDADLTDPTKREILAGAVSRLFSRIDLYFVGLPSRHKWIREKQKEMEAATLKRNQIYFKLRNEAPFLQERFFIGTLNEVGSKPYPSELFDEDFAELYEDNKPPGSNPHEEFKEIQSQLAR